MQKDFSNHSTNDPTFLKRKENANDCTTSSWQGLSKTTEPSLAVNKYDKEKNNRSKESKNSTTRLTLKRAGGSTKSRGETCRQLRPSSSNWDPNPIGRRAVGILSIQAELGPVSVAWRKTSRQPTEGVNSTPTQTACTDAHRLSQHILNGGERS